MNLDRENINDLEGVDIYNPKGGDTLVYDEISNEWVNVASSSESTDTTFYVKVSTISALPAVTYNNGAGTLTKTTNGTLPSIDGISLSVGDRLLVKNQVASLQNGIYEVTDLGSVSTPFVLTRPSDYNQTAEVYPSQINILSGTTYAAYYFIQSTVDPVIGTNGLVYRTIPAPVVPTAPVAFVNTVTSTVLPNTPTYLGGVHSAANPGYLATYTSSTNAAFPTINGVAPFINMTILVKDQADATKNGDYVLIQLGSGSTKWILRRVSYYASSFYPRLWEVNAGDMKGFIYQQDTKTLTNATIGVSGNIVFTAISKAVLPFTIQLAISDLDTALTTGTTKGFFFAPHDGTVTEVIGCVGDEQVSGSVLTFDINKNSTTILSTKITVDNNEQTSLTAATPPVISVSSMAKGDYYEIDIDQVGDGTAKKGQVIINGTRPI